MMTEMMTRGRSRDAFAGQKPGGSRTFVLAAHLAAALGREVPGDAVAPPTWPTVVEAIVGWTLDRNAEAADSSRKLHPRARPRTASGRYFAPYPTAPSGS